jgi:hypothetical protein
MAKVMQESSESAVSADQIVKDFLQNAASHCGVSRFEGSGCALKQRARSAFEDASEDIVLDSYSTLHSLDIFLWHGDALGGLIQKLLDLTPLVVVPVPSVACSPADTPSAVAAALRFEHGEDYWCMAIPIVMFVPIALSCPCGLTKDTHCRCARMPTNVMRGFVHPCPQDKATMPVAPLPEKTTTQGYILVAGREEKVPAKLYLQQLKKKAVGKYWAWEGDAVSYFGNLAANVCAFRHSVDFGGSGVIVRPQNTNYVHPDVYISVYSSFLEVLQMREPGAEAQVVDIGVVDGISADAAAHCAISSSEVYWHSARNLALDILSAALIERSHTVREDKYTGNLSQLALTQLRAREGEGSVQVAGLERRNASQNMSWDEHVSKVQQSMLSVADSVTELLPLLLDEVLPIPFQLSPREPPKGKPARSEEHAGSQLSRHTHTAGSVSAEETASHTQTHTSRQQAGSSTRKRHNTRDNPKQATPSEREELQSDSDHSAASHTHPEASNPSRGMESPVGDSESD